MRSHRTARDHETLKTATNSSTALTPFATRILAESFATFGTRTRFLTLAAPFEDERSSGMLVETYLFGLYLFIYKRVKNPVANTLTLRVRRLHNFIHGALKGRQRDAEKIRKCTVFISCRSDNVIMEFTIIVPVIIINSRPCY